MSEPSARNEEWRAVEGWPYEVSNLGRVRHQAWPSTSLRVNHCLRPYRDARGYVLVWLCDDGDGKRLRVHRLVAGAFIGPAPTARHQINHRDGDKENNTPANLEWVTGRENERHASELGLKARGERTAGAVLTESAVLAIRGRHGEGVSMVSLAHEYGVSPDTISLAVRRRTWRHLP